MSGDSRGQPDHQRGDDHQSNHSFWYFLVEWCCDEEVLAEARSIHQRHALSRAAKQCRIELIVRQLLGLLSKILEGSKYFWKVRCNHWAKLRCTGARDLCAVNNLGLTGRKWH